MRLYIAVLLLAGCTAERPVADAPPHACRLDRVVDLSMVAGTPYAVIPARLDGQAVSMLLDTGDERLTVTRQAQARLRLPEDHHHTTTIHGVGGASTGFDAILQRFEIGNVELPQSGAAVIDFRTPPVVDPPMAGIVGGQILSDYDVEFDFNARRVVLWQREGCDTVAPAWTGAWSSVHLARGSGNLLTMDVTADGQVLHALLDTGALTSLIDIDAAGRLGMTAAGLAVADSSVSRGADDNDLVAHVARIGDLAVGGVHMTHARVLVGPVHLPYADMMLGVDFLQHRDLWLSYASQQAFIR